MVRKQMWITSLRQQIPGILHKKEMLMAGWEHDW
jgi:hypothetical protein